MKLNEHEVHGLDLAVEELDCVKQQDEEFWRGIRELVRYGVPAYDQRGHWAEIRMKVRPLQVDMIAAVREKMPEGWFKTMASLHRSILAVGCKVILRLVDKDVKEWHEILDGLNQMAKKVRLEEFKKDMVNLRGNIVEQSTMTAEEKVRVADFVAYMEKRLLELEGNGGGVEKGERRKGDKAE